MGGGSKSQALSTHCTGRETEAAQFKSHNDEVSEAGLEPGPPDLWPVVEAEP